MKKAKARSGRLQAISKDNRTSATNVLNQYEKVLNKSFTSRERELIRKQGVRLVVKDIDKDDFKASGCYAGRRRGKHMICLDDSKPMDEETMIHETVHILQRIDPHRPVFEKRLGRGSEDVNLREALTEAETVSRSSTVNTANAAYYEDLKKNKTTDGKSPIALKRRDRNMFRSDKMAAESPAENVHENFFRSSIQFLEDPVSGKTARATYINKRKKK